MTDSVRPDRTVSVFLGRPRKLRYNHFAIAEFEDAAKLDFIQVVRDATKMLSYRVQLFLLWAGLLHQDPMLTPQDVGAMLDEYIGQGGDKAELFDRIRQALEASEVFQQGKKDAEAAANVLDPKAPAQLGGAVVDVAATRVELPPTP